MMERTKIQPRHSAEKPLANQHKSVPKRPRPGLGAWTQDPDGVKKNILEVARQEFVANGLSGARVDEIAAKTATSKRMIYYYFTDKKGLYSAVLEEAYKRIRLLEIKLDPSSLPPLEAMASLVGFTFDYHADNPDFVRLVMVENIHHAVHLKNSETIKALNMPAISIVREIYIKGVNSGIFRPGLDPLDIHLTISALSYYNVSNRESILQVFGHDMAEAEARAKRRATVINLVCSFLLVHST
jgi:AcrR family transcriptional regulator